jgi:hypothetical protein
LETCGGDLPKIADVSILKIERSLRQWAFDGAAPTPSPPWDGTLWGARIRRQHGGQKRDGRIARL